MSFIADVKWHLDRAMVTDRYSSSLVAEFDALVETRSANVFQVFEEIAALEQSPNAKEPSHTKVEMPLDRPWLKGLWHKHYPTPAIPPHHHTPLFSLGPDKTPYRKLAACGVRGEKAMGTPLV